MSEILLASRKATLGILVAMGGFVAGCPTVAAEGKSGTFDQKLPEPRESAATAIESPVEIQFRKDTGETGRTRRIEVTRPMRLGPMPARDHLRFPFDLSAWPAALQAQARLWVAVAAPSAITADGNLSLTFSQNGVGMTTALNNTYNVEGTVVLATDFALKEGEVTMEVENRTNRPHVDYVIQAIVYVPAKPEPTKTQ